MEYFHLKENSTFDGILKSAYNSQYLLYPEANGKITNSQAIEVITNTSDCVFWVNGVSEGTYIEFGFKRKKVLVTGYQFSTTPDGSPPYEWTLTGSNSKHGKFKIINSPPETNDTCNYKIGTSQCNERVMNSFYINKGTIPYKYIRFNVIRNRYAKI